VASRRPLPRVLQATRDALLDLLPVLFLTGFTVAVFFTELTGGPIYFGRDTTTFYYPLTHWAAEELRAGRLPVWTPLIFGGYPILADGEIGLLSPFQLLFLTLFEMPLAYSAMRVLDYAVAALGMYLYARALGANGLGATIGALAFAYSSFMIGHLQHDNILRSAIWLPWLLLAAERALQVKGARRPFWIAAAALVLALQSVGVHVQPVLMSLLAFGLALLFGPFGKTSIPSVLAPSVSLAATLGRLVHDARQLLNRKRLSAANPLDWLVGRVLLGLAVVGLGIGLAAVQILPLYQLGQRSLRPTLATYDYATSFAVSPPQILTLFLPAMFNFDAERHWALWAPHESTLYVGIAPLLLAVIALAFVRGRAVVFYGIVAMVSLALVFGDYLPIKPYTVIWNLPGFTYLRAPARFSLLLSLSLAVLAALGASWITRQARYRGPTRPIVGLLSTMLLLPVLLGLGLGAVRWWLRFDPVTSTDLFRVLLQTSKENWQLGQWHVYYGLTEMTRPDNPRTALGLGLLVLVPILLRVWLVRPRLEALWGALLLLLTAADLWVFATGFYFQAPVNALVPETPAVAHIASQPGPFRTFVEPALNQRLGANQLAGAGIETVNGYSSLEPPRYSDYFWSVVGQDNALLDLFDVRYVLAAHQVPGTRTFEGISFHPHDRLMSGTAVNPTGQEAFRPPPTWVQTVVLVAAVEGLGDTSTGTTIADVTLVGPDGSRQVVPVRAGIEVAEYRAPEPGWPTADYVGPRVIWAGSEFDPYHRGQGPPVRLYGATVPLAQPFETVGVEVRTVTPVGRFHLYGLGFVAPDNATFSFRPPHKAKYRPLMQDATSVLLENTAARPRVSLVGGAIAANGPTTADRLHEIAWDPQREAIVEGLRPEEIRRSTSSGPVGEARLLEYAPTRIVAQADLAEPGYLILADRFDEGWSATVDDQSVPIARANGVERLVSVPAGSHVVTFSYAPFVFSLGIGLSVIASVAWLGLLLVALAQATGLIRLFSRRRSGQSAVGSRP
jgi:hypothetical protein